MYWHEDDEASWFFGPEWDLDASINRLSNDLSYMRDFSEDIRIIGNPIFMEGARRAADAVDPRILVIEIHRDAPRAISHELRVYVMFRRSQALAFFERYYGKR